MIGHPFWGYASILFDFLIIFIIPLGFAVRELILLNRHDREHGRDEPG